MVCVGPRKERDRVRLDYGGMARPPGFFGFIFVGNRQPLVILSKGEMQLAVASVLLIPPQNPSSSLVGGKTKAQRGVAACLEAPGEMFQAQQNEKPTWLSLLLRDQRPGLWELLVPFPPAASSLPTSSASGLLPALHQELCTVSGPSPSLEQPVGFCCN